MKHIASIRMDYIKGVLHEADLDHNPFEQFAVWMDQALNSEVPEPTAMAVATAALSGRPSVRMALLKGFNNDGFQFFTNYYSRKAQELLANPQASLLFFWKELERQVRIEGSIVKLSEQESDAYFASRPRESQIGAWVSPQSQVIESRSVIESQMKARTLEFQENTVPRPQDWGGFLLIPDYFEFWQGRESRLHDRFAYNFIKNSSWNLCRLAP
ncbi:MAG: pyridoxamine 5'-phosphate oxidase [Bacteroidota bacterium]